jgi:hypothetical protein
LKEGFKERRRMPRAIIGLKKIPSATAVLPLDSSSELHQILKLIRPVVLSANTEISGDLVEALHVQR